MASLCHFLTNFICSRALRPIFVRTKSCQQPSLVYDHVPRIESSPINFIIFIEQTRCCQIGLRSEIQADFKTFLSVLNAISQNNSWSTNTCKKRQPNAFSLESIGFDSCGVRLSGDYKQWKTISPFSDSTPRAR